MVKDALVVCLLLVGAFVTYFAALAVDHTLNVSIGGIDLKWTELEHTRNVVLAVVLVSAVQSVIAMFVVIGAYTFRR